MTTLNAYASLADLKAYLTSRGGSTIPADTTDDTVLEAILQAAADQMETQSGRTWLPHVETRYYDVPEAESLDPRELKLDGDLLEVLTLTNGEGTVIPNTEYKLLPRNVTPYHSIRLNDSSTYYWSPDASGDVYSVISVLGVWGLHKRYYSAWMIGSTLAEDLDTSEAGVDVTSGSAFGIGQIVRIGNELGYVSNVATNTLTITRGENGSTAATHTSGGAVKIWQIDGAAKQACLEIAAQADKRRYGQSQSNVETVTAAGIVLSPRDIPAMAAEFIKANRAMI